MTSRVIVGVFTYEGHKHCRELFLKSLAALKHPHLEFVFVTNSGENDKEDILEKTKDFKHKVSVFVDDSVHEHVKDKVVSGRNLVREKILETNAEWVHLMDSDVIAPTNRIEVFLNDKKDLLTGYYLGIYTDKNKKKHILPMVYGYKKGYFCRQLKLPEVLEPRLFKVVMSGMGLTFMHRIILEKVKFRSDEKKIATEDAFFFEDCAKEGFQLWCDTRVAGLHMKYPPGDKRNAVRDPRRYAMKQRNSSDTPTQPL